MLPLTGRGVGGSLRAGPRVRAPARDPRHGSHVVAHVVLSLGALLMAFPFLW